MTLHDYAPLIDPRTVLVDNVNSTQILGPNVKRRAVIINAPPVNRVTISLTNSAVLDQGITLYPGGQPFQITTGNVGRALEGPISAISAVAPQNVTIIDVMDA